MTSRAPAPRSRTARAWLAALACAGLACAELSQLGLGPAPLSEATVASGLKEALEVGAGRATSRLSRSGGFSDDPALRLALPKQLDTLATSLRGIGLGSQVDAIEKRMNLAAERAAGEALPVFVSAIESMTVADAFAILNGPDTAATDYFREKTSGALRERFAPVVDDSMREVGLVRAYEDAAAAYAALPFAKPQAPDLGDYVTGQTLAALFSRLAAEEERIREDPAARTTALLRRVFGESSTR